MKDLLDSTELNKKYLSWSLSSTVLCSGHASARTFASLCLSLALAFCSPNVIVCHAAAAKLSVSSNALKNEGSVVPKKYTGEGDDSSPPLAWSKGPSNTKSYAVCCEDPDAPGGTWWHWMVYNIAADTTELQAGLPKTASLEHGMMQGRNDFHKTGYNGPLPPPGQLHHYEFKVQALDTMLKLAPNASKSAFAAALKGHVLAEGQLTGTYKR